ncbi:MAG: hypothetical protein ACRCX8_05040 [Sarcina sp.]
MIKVMKSKLEMLKMNLDKYEWTYVKDGMGLPMITTEIGDIEVDICIDWNNSNIYKIYSTQNKACICKDYDKKGILEYIRYMEEEKCI